MGAGYKTAKLEFIDDKMLKLPYQLMGDVIKATDDGNDMAYESISAFQDMLQLKSLEKDSPQAKELVRSYEDQADRITQELMKNPLEYQRKLREIRGVARGLNQDRQYGKWAAIEDRYNADIEFAKKLEEADVSDEYRILKRQQALQEAGSLEYNADTGKYNKYVGGNITLDVDINEKMESYIKGINPDVESVSYDSYNGAYEIRTFDGKTETIRDADIYNIVMNKLGADPEVMASLKDRADLKMNGYANLYNDDGTLNLVEGTTPFKRQLANGRYVTDERVNYANNILGNAMSAIADKYNKYDTSIKTGIKGAPGADARLKHELEKQDQITSVTVDQGVKISNGITSSEDLVKKQEAITQGTQALMSRATDELKKVLNRDLSDEELSALREGDFDLLFEGQTNSPNYNPFAVQEMKSQYQSIMRQQAVVDAYEDAFVQKYDEFLAVAGEGFDTSIGFGNKTKGETITINGREYNKREFDTFVSMQENTVIPVKAGFIDTPKPQQQMIQGQIKSLAESGQAEFTINDETNITDLAQLIKDGGVVFKVETLKSNDPELMAKQKEYQQLRSTPTANLSEIDLQRRDNLMRELMMNQGATFEYVPSHDLANFEVEEESILPQQDYGQRDNLEFIGGLRYNGKVVKVNFTNVSSPDVEAYEQRHKNALTINKFGAAHSGVERINVPVHLDEYGNAVYAKNTYYNPNKQEVITERADGTFTRVNIYSDDASAGFVRSKLFGIDE